MTVDTTTLAQELPDASIAEIAAVIAHDWGKKVNFAAAPYLEAMFDFETIHDKWIVVYFLSNAGTWRGPVAKLVKAELKRRVK